MRQLLTDLRGNPISFAARRRQRRVRHPHLPTLFYLVQNQSWPDVIRRARTHPHEIVVQEEGSGNTPLHVACRLDPPANVVQALLVASRYTNAEGSTPLHVAATHRVSVEVIRVLLLVVVVPDERGTEALSTSPTASLTRMGRAPIHYACMSFRGLSVEAFRTLLDATLQYGHLELPSQLDDDDELGFFDHEDNDDDNDNEPFIDAHMKPTPQVVNVMTLRDSTGQTPLGLLFRRYRERVRCVIQTVERLQTEQERQNTTSTIHSATTNPPLAHNLMAAMTVQADLGELWEKARLIVGRLTEERLQREGLTSLDESGWRSPGEAAIAQEAAAWAAEQYRRSLHQFDDSSSSSSSSSSACSNTVGNRQFRIVHASVGLTGYGCPPELIRLAISIHPTQVYEMDEDGNLPLHIAAVASSYVTHHHPSTGTMDNNHNSDNTTPASDGDSLLSNSLWSVNTSTTASPGQPYSFDKVIRILLRHYPAAARIPQGRSGRLPLVLAMIERRRSWKDGIRTLLEAFPPALSSTRDTLKLVPYILAKVTATRTRTKGSCCVESHHDGGPSRQPQRQATTHHLSLSQQRRRQGNTPSTKSSSSSLSSRGLNTLFELIQAQPDLVQPFFEYGSHANNNECVRACLGGNGSAALLS